MRICRTMGQSWQWWTSLDPESQMRLLVYDEWRQNRIRDWRSGLLNKLEKGIPADVATQLFMESL